MVMILNKQQKEYLIKAMFTPIDIYKIFDCIYTDGLVEQNWKLIKDKHNWYRVIVDGIEYTSVNFNAYPEVLEKLKTL